MIPLSNYQTPSVWHQCKWRLAVPVWLLIAMATTMSASAQTPGMVSFQGLIRDSGGTPIATPVSLEFRIFTADTGGILVDMDGDGTVETTPAAPGGGTDVILVGPLAPTGGIVTTKFGPVSPKAFAGCTPGAGGCRWLEVTVVGSATPLSRIEMVTQPGAAEQVNKPATGDSAIVTDASGNVGIGTAAPQTRLHVNGPALPSHLGSTLGSLAIEAPFSGAGYTALDFASNHNNIPAARISALHDGVVGSSLNFGTSNDYGSGITNVAMTIDHIGHVGVGTTSPFRKLHVVGSALVARFESDDTSAAGIEIRNGSSNKGWGVYVNGAPGSQGPPGSLYVYPDGGSIPTPLIVTPTGKVGIGTVPTSSSMLEVAGNVTDNRILLRQTNGGAGAAGGIEFANSNSVTQWVVGTNISVGDGFEIDSSTIVGASALYIAPTTGNVGIGTGNPTAKLHVNGGILASGCTGCSSDERLKKNIETVSSALGRLLSLRGVWFNWKDPKSHGDEARRQMGFIAQEVERVLPEWVMKDKDGYRYLSTNGFPALATEAIRELKTENDALKSKVSTLERRLARLEAALAGSNAPASGHSIPDALEVRK